MPCTVDPGPGDALIVVDVQQDFLPDGALGVADGDAVVPVLNEWIQRFEAAGLPVVFSRDWHPANHCSFEAQGGIWPPHCVAGSQGAEFADALRLPEGALIVSKATGAGEEAYSAFDGTNLSGMLARQGVKRVFVGGLATDYCVKATVEDALGEGLGVLVIADAIRSVDVKAGDGDRALESMRAGGAGVLANG
jgi:nicotinamidase/pyrazinamidase